MRFSRRLAWLFGVAAPLVETVRRWGTWQQYPPALFDDYLLGALLLAGAWATRDPANPRAARLLAGAWGFACGLGYYSVFGQWHAYRAGEQDPSGFSPLTVFFVKLAGTLLAALALRVTVRALPEGLPAGRFPSATKI
jgi:hypothetical protein